VREGHGNGSNTRRIAARETMPTMSRHLDLGCGDLPRNPYGRDEVHGVDLRPNGRDPRVVRANLAVAPIPFPDNHFDSVSAYDFLEHVPRLLPTAGGHDTRLPFVELMDEIWRVLVPGGLLYAQTPVTPHDVSFSDPTHVNPVGRVTVRYFVRPWLHARMYGFRGEFEARRVYPFVPRVDYEPLTRDGRRASLRQRVRDRLGRCTHILWELEAAKR
jgi:SAM-dependent methyltransferase